MSTLLVLAAALAAQGVPQAEDLDRQTIQQKDVAYEQVATGESQAAIDRLELLLSENPEDPALLINLGTALQQAGDLEKAADAYRAASESKTRYRLELADGSWVDSRRAARRALMAVEDRMVAMR